MQLIKTAFCKTNYWTWRALLQVQTKQTINKSTARAISFASSFCKKYLPERHTNPQKSEQGKKALQGASITRGKYYKGGVQEQLVSCVGEGVDFPGSKFMGLTCDIIWGSPLHELQKYPPYPMQQGFYNFGTHFLSTLLNMKP